MAERHDRAGSPGKQKYMVCYKATGSLEIEAESENAARAEFENLLQDAMDELRHSSLEITEILEGT